MTYLLDVNLLIALLDANHIHYQAAHDWFKRTGSRSWATCPLTENGFLRIVGSPSYPNSFGSPSLIFELLAEFCARKEHEFWPDDFSILALDRTENSTFIPARHVTDLYLLALAGRRRGRLASLDRHLPTSLVPHGSALFHLVTP